MASVFDVAKYILEKMGEPVSTWKLQKLVYYAQAWSLVWDEAPLFRERIEAWANGPVCPELYKIHRGNFYISSNDVKKGMAESLTNEQRETLDAVIKYYGDKSGSYLSALTHKERPWKETRGDLPAGTPSSREIPLDLMADYYGAIAAEEKKETPQ